MLTDAGAGFPWWWYSREGGNGEVRRSPIGDPIACLGGSAILSPFFSARWHRSRRCGIEGREINLVDQVMQSVGEGAGHQLRFQVHRQKPWTHVNMLEVRHPRPLAAKLLLQQDRGTFPTASLGSV